MRECAAALRDDAGVLDEAAWRRLAHRLADAEPATDWDAEFEMESMAFEDIVQRAYTDNGRGDGRLTPAGARLLLAIASATRVDAAATWLAGTAASAWVGRAEMLREHRRHMEALRALNAQPLWNRDDRRANELMRQCGEAWYRAKYFPVAITLPALGEVSRRVQLAAARREALLIAIALELHRRREGAYPSSLGALVPALLPAVGRDPFDGRPLRYTLRDGRPVVYSIGADRDDDGGAAPSEAPVRGMIPAHEWISPDDAAARAGEIEDGDWILWPPANPPL